MAKKVSTEAKISHIQRKTRRQSTAEEKIRIIHGQVASYACSLAEKSLLYFHPILSHRLRKGTSVASM